MEQGKSIPSYLCNLPALDLRVTITPLKAHLCVLLALRRIEWDCDIRECLGVDKLETGALF